MRSSSSRPEIVEARRGRREQLGDRALVHVGVLPQVERRQMEAEHVDRAAQPRSRPRATTPAVGALERQRDHGEVGGELRRRSRRARASTSGWRSATTWSSSRAVAARRE